MQLLSKATLETTASKLFRRFDRSLPNSSDRISKMGFFNSTQRQDISSGTISVRELMIRLTGQNPSKSTPTIVTFPIAGENFVREINYTEPDREGNSGRVWIDRTQYFENVPPEVWHYCSGSYYLCQKWLIAREGSFLSQEAIEEYQRLVMLLKDTIDLITNLDLVFK
jgi:hypothetical protein